MPQTVTYHSATHLVETKAHGNLTLDEAKEMVSEIGQVCVEKNCFLYLSNYPEMTLNSSTLAIRPLCEYQGRDGGIAAPTSAEIRLQPKPINDTGFFDID